MKDLSRFSLISLFLLPRLPMATTPSMARTPPAVWPDVVVNSHAEGRMLYHCNFGWTGTSDGYYVSNLLFDVNRGATEIDKNLGDRGGNEDAIYAHGLMMLTYTNI